MVGTCGDSCYITVYPFHLTLLIFCLLSRDGQPDHERQETVEQAARSVRLLRFGVYEIDLEAGELYKNRRRVSLQEQPFQVLALLLTHPGLLVTREDIQKRLWPSDTFVDFDLGLNTAIRKIRTALSDSADNPKFVETLPRRGYRFICPVQEPDSVAIGAMPAIENAAGTASPAKTPPSPSLPGNAAVTSEPSHRRRRLALSALAIVALLAGLSYYRLNNGSGHGRRSRAELERLGERGTRDDTAWEFYVTGRNILEADDGADSGDNAIQAFEQAVKVDPLYALAYGGLGEAYIRKYTTTGEEKWRGRADEDCGLAVNLDFTRPAGRICKGVVDNSLGLYREAVKEFTAAIEIDAHSARALQGRARACVGQNKIADAEKDYQQAIHLAPGNWQSHSALAEFYFNRSRYGEAARQYEAALHINPDDRGLNSGLGTAYFLMRQYDKAIPVLEHAVELRRTFADYEKLGLSFFYRRRFTESIQSFRTAIQLNDLQGHRGFGNLARAFFWTPGLRNLSRPNYEQAIALAEQELKAAPDDVDVHLMLGVYYAMLKDKDNALLHLNFAQMQRPDAAEVSFWAAVVCLQVENRSRALAWLGKAASLGYSGIEIDAAPEFDSLHADPEFQRIMSTAVTGPQAAR